MAIAYVTTANTFQQWLISSQDLITTANNLTDGGNTGALRANELSAGASGKVKRTRYAI